MVASAPPPRSSPTSSWMAALTRRRPQQMSTMSSYTLVLLFLATAVFGVTLLGLFLSLSHGTNNPHDYNPVSQSLRQFQRRTEDNKAVVYPTITHVDYPVEEPIPNPPGGLPDGYDTFAACLLVMDDNHRLPEFFAYHYHVLPLRYVIVAVDPRSKTSPTHLFNQWRRQGLHIDEWQDSDFWQKSTKFKPIPDDAVLQMKRDRHRGRQKFFYRSCLTRMKQLNRTWVSLHDSDEYLVYNHPGGDLFEAWQQRLEKRVATRPDARKLEVLRPSKPPPTVAEPGQMIKYIRQEQAAGLKFYQSPCLGIPRLMFGAEESPPSQRDRSVPTGFDADQFDTLRFRKHARRNDFVKNALGKVIIDVSRVDMKKTPYFESLHRPIKTICPAPWHNDWDSGLRINHYLGTWESYSFRDDARRGGERSYEQWEYKATTNSEGTDDNIRPWLDGFVREQGPSKAGELLSRAGLPKGYRNVNDTAWSLHPDKLQTILDVNTTEQTNDNKKIAFDEWVRDKYIKKQ